MPIRMKVYHRGRETLVAACDEELLGKTFRERGLKIEVSGFYAGDPVTEEQLLAHLRLATIGNFVGKETIAIVARGMKYVTGFPVTSMEYAILLRIVRDVNPTPKPTKNRPRETRPIRKYHPPRETRIAPKAVVNANRARTAWNTNRGGFATDVDRYCP